VCSYVDNPGVDAARGTETYAHLTLSVDLPRWRGVPFVLRTGKALGRSRRRIEVHFRSRPKTQSAAPAVLCFEMAPNRVSLELPAAGDRFPGAEPVLLETTRPRQALPASARMLLDVFAGNATFLVRDDEVEECWRIVDPVLSAWRAGIPPLHDYPAGSLGPQPGMGG
jgi:glucose-6-phosphate 1-dehydrogenase